MNHHEYARDKDIPASQLERCHLCGGVVRVPGGYQDDVVLHSEALGHGECRMNGFYRREDWNAMWAQIRASIMADNSSAGVTPRNEDLGQLGSIPMEAIVKRFIDWSNTITAREPCDTLSI